MCGTREGRTARAVGAGVYDLYYRRCLGELAVCCSVCLMLWNTCSL